MLLAHSASLAFRSISPPLIFLRVMCPRKLAWILAAAALASGSSRGMSRMSSSSFVQAPSCRQRAAVMGALWGLGGRVCAGDGVGKVPSSHKVQKSKGEIGERWGK